MQMLDFDKEVRVDIERYKKMIEMYSSGNSRTGELGPGSSITDNTKEVERHLKNIIRELEALLRDK
jgi:hypothetical protein